MGIENGTSLEQEDLSSVKDLTELSKLLEKNPNIVDDMWKPELIKLTAELKDILDNPGVSAQISNMIDDLPDNLFSPEDKINLKWSLNYFTTPDIKIITESEAPEKHWVVERQKTSIEDKVLNALSKKWLSNLEDVVMIWTEVVLNDILWKLVSEEWLDISVGGVRDTLSSILISIDNKLPSNSIFKGSLGFVVKNFLSWEKWLRMIDGALKVVMNVEWSNNPNDLVPLWFDAVESSFGLLFDLSASLVDDPDFKKKISVFLDKEGIRQALGDDIVDMILSIWSQFFASMDRNKFMASLSSLEDGISADLIDGIAKWWDISTWQKFNIMNQSLWFIKELVVGNNPDAIGVMLDSIGNMWFVKDNPMLSSVFGILDMLGDDVPALLISDVFGILDVITDMSLNAKQLTDKLLGSLDSIFVRIWGSLQAIMADPKSKAEFTKHIMNIYNISQVKKAEKAKNVSKQWPSIDSRDKVSWPWLPAEEELSWWEWADKKVDQAMLVAELVWKVRDLAVDNAVDFVWDLVDGKFESTWDIVSWLIENNIFHQIQLWDFLGTIGELIGVSFDDELSNVRELVGGKLEMKERVAKNKVKAKKAPKNNFWKKIQDSGVVPGLVNTIKWNAMAMVKDKMFGTGDSMLDMWDMIGLLQNSIVGFSNQNMDQLVDLVGTIDLNPLWTLDGEWSKLKLDFGPEWWKYLVTMITKLVASPEFADIANDLLKNWISGILSMSGDDNIFAVIDNFVAELKKWFTKSEMFSDVIKKQWLKLVLNTLWDKETLQSLWETLHDSIPQLWVISKNTFKNMLGVIGDHLDADEIQAALDGVAEGWGPSFFTEYAPWDYVKLIGWILEQKDWNDKFSFLQDVVASWLLSEFSDLKPMLAKWKQKKLDKWKKIKTFKLDEASINSLVDIVYLIWKQDNISEWVLWTVLAGFGQPPEMAWVVKDFLSMWIKQKDLANVLLKHKDIINKLAVPKAFKNLNLKQYNALSTDEERVVFAQDSEKSNQVYQALIDYPDRIKLPAELENKYNLLWTKRLKQDFIRDNLDNIVESNWWNIDFDGLDNFVSPHLSNDLWVNLDSYNALDNKESKVRFLLNLQKEFTAHDISQDIAPELARLWLNLDIYKDVLSKWWKEYIDKFIKKSIKWSLPLSPELIDFAMDFVDTIGEKADTNKFSSLLDSIMWKKVLDNLSGPIAALLWMQDDLKGGKNDILNIVTSLIKTLPTEQLSIILKNPQNLKTLQKFIDKKTTGIKPSIQELWSLGIDVISVLDFKVLSKVDGIPEKTKRIFVLLEWVKSAIVANPELKKQLFEEWMLDNIMIMKDVFSGKATLPKDIDVKSTMWVVYDLLQNIVKSDPENLNAIVADLLWPMFDKNSKKAVKKDKKEKTALPKWTIWAVLKYNTWFILKTVVKVVGWWIANGFKFKKAIEENAWNYIVDFFDRSKWKEKFVTMVDSILTNQNDAGIPINTNRKKEKSPENTINNVIVENNSSSQKNNTNNTING